MQRYRTFKTSDQTRVSKGLIFVNIVLVLGLLSPGVIAKEEGNQMKQKTYVSISETIAHCTAKGVKIPPHLTPMQSELKKITSLIGMAYLNYIYQNDLENLHFCESMLLMNSQVPANTENPYVHLFDVDNATKTMPILEDIQLSFDYSIARTDPPLDKLKASIAIIQKALKYTLRE